jgi:mannose-1-phosphate guanylyltransferase/phosphomannomutase
MQVVILCGGLGTRLKSSTPELPKILHEIKGKTILEWQIRQLPPTANDILLLIGNSLNHHFYLQEVEKLKEKYNCKINLFFETGRPGTGGALKAAKSKLRKKFVVILGDVLFDAPVEHLYGSLNSEFSLAIWVRETDHPSDSDLVRIKESGLTQKFLKYPHKQNEIDVHSYGATGLFAMKRKFIKYFPKEESFDFFEALTKLRPKVMLKCRAVVSLHDFKDIGTQERFSGAELFIEKLESKKRVELFVIDRDDTIIYDPNKSMQQNFVYNDKIIEKLKNVLRSNEQSLFSIVTNQPSIAKGIKSRSEVDSENLRIGDYLLENGLPLVSIKYCPHHPEKGHSDEIPELKIVCRCRKPFPGLVIDMVKELNLNPLSLVIIGDSKFDYELARILGCDFQLERFKPRKSYIPSFIQLGFWRFQSIRSHYI